MEHESATAVVRPPGLGRVFSIDRLRALGIALALFSHGMGEVTGGWALLQEHSDVYYAVRFCTRLATPVLLVALGASAEFAYVRRWQTNRPDAVRKLVKRALQCWLALVAVALSAALGGDEVRKSLLGIVMLASPRGGEIFELYVVTFFLMLLLIPLRLRLGLPATLAVVLLWWPVGAVLRVLDPGTPYVGHIASRITGLHEITGPSVLHSLSLIVLGMILGRAVADRRAQVRSSARSVLTISGILACGVLVATVQHRGARGLLEGYVDFNDFRVHNHPAYFAVGFLGSLTLLIVLRGLLRAGLGGPLRTGPFSRASLLSFTLGNVAINLVLTRVPTPNTAADVIASVVLILALWVGMRSGRSLRERWGKPPARRGDLTSGMASANAVRDPA